MFGRDWTHLGVAKLYTQIVSNGYHILYLTSRSVGQADTTRAYLKGVVQEKHRLPNGPVILSPDRTMAALKREIYLRKPEIFKMACLRDFRDLFLPHVDTPFYAGFGNRLTDAMSYRSVNIPSNRIFTINSNAEVSLDLLTLNKYKSTYVSMRELVDHFFPPVKLLIKAGGEEFTDFTYWRDTPLELDDFSDSESEEEDGSDDEGSEILEDEDVDDMNASFVGSYIDGQSIAADDLGDSFMESSQVLEPEEEPTEVPTRTVSESEKEIKKAYAQTHSKSPSLNHLPEGLTVQNYSDSAVDQAIDTAQKKDGKNHRLSQTVLENVPRVASPGVVESVKEKGHRHVVSESNIRR
jgi:phosphatidate phosphatase LPIN